MKNAKYVTIQINLDPNPAKPMKGRGNKRHLWQHRRLINSLAAKVWEAIPHAHKVTISERGKGGWIHPHHYISPEAQRAIACLSLDT